MFDREKAERAFRGLSARTVEDLPIAEAFAHLVRFYRTQTAEGARPDEEDGDMLLYQWGTYDWQDGTGSRFEISLTRQLIYPEGEDQEIWQLSLTYGFESSPAFAQLKGGEEWCSSKEKAQEFLDMILASPAFAACRDGTPLRMQIGWGRC